MKIRLSAPVTIDSIVDGEGVRAVIWTQGCIHNCSGCHNPRTHSFDGGYDEDVRSIVDTLEKLKIHKGITLSGGDPFEQPLPLVYICREAKKLGMDVWAYTGYTFEQLTDEENIMYREWIQLLKEVDILVDGKFEQEKKDLLLRFRGSSNQRILDVKKSLEAKKPIIHGNYVDDRFE
ncbi:anaerobic ribonucleoside-triphosphate reductase activating protein [Peptoclostridium litorale DSM 5388]|uniref:Anaerobic ribonucleoside-triphosphate reductase-activating protein n=1 Tax=Peptoclostridium litorale DSM 5388 TaxID=1121324 RepID=A0A069RL38_PEPLI|nr:anaerobic ribonucleoside-triphosphate reductase activating protein [Peptoclostridium litorale]KDR94932.1 anaerobic ribonucleoside-triphosphate reductase-activating protein NrdG [Peptoclostridium litorale DSM 5388]SIN95976.1 anaerobic ribonucleoside-triphosphate reductase activating protein [Peptoclostridium litorale DSM 5388]